MSFINDYRQYASGNESPPTFHLYSAFVALSAIISRRVWIELGYFNVYTNMYVVLVGPPGIKKSTAISIARRLLYELKTVPLVGECTSKEKLILDLCDNQRAVDGLPPEHEDKKIYTPGTAMVSELSEFFQISGEGMVGLLTDIYDIQHAYEHKTKNKGTVILNNPYFCILAATTPSWMATYLRGDIITGGFTRRCLFVYEDIPGPRVAIPELTNDQKNAWIRLFTAAQRIAGLKGPFVWTPDAKAFFVHWYETHERPKDPNLVGYYETRQIILLKIAMLTAISEEEKLVLEVRHIEAALKFLHIIEQNMPRVFEGVGKNELNAAATKLLMILRQCPAESIAGHAIHRMAVKRMQSIMYAEVDHETFNKILEHLVQTDKIVLRTLPDGATHREYIVLKEDLKPIQDAHAKTGI